MFKAHKSVIPHHIQRQINEAQWDFMANMVADTVAAYSELAKAKRNERVNAVVTGQTTCLVDMANAKTLVRIRVSCFMDEITIDVQSNIGHPKNFKGMK
ncbi:hypothetical protein [Klebsiella pneumoniae]|uniref:hypothetical protein n=1 Tax=Klebsiella pneumoniae TaxID=573 RepID=UPI0025A1C84A|nr:hypothetical protein [Klebsiella pneumoniae]